MFAAASGIKTGKLPEPPVAVQLWDSHAAWDPESVMTAEIHPCI